MRDGTKGPKRGDAEVWPVNPVGVESGLFDELGLGSNTNAATGFVSVLAGRWLVGPIPDLFCYLDLDGAPTTVNLKDNIALLCGSA